MTQHAGTLQVTNQLNPFTEILGQIMEQYQKVMVDISTKLPHIEDSIDNNIVEARELLSFIDSTESDIASYGIRHEFQQFHNQLNSSIEVFSDIAADDKTLFNQLQNALDLSLNTLENVKNVSSISEDLKVFAINSIVHSHNIGNEGKGYQMISTEFIKLSGMIAQGSQEISKQGVILEKLIQEKLLHGINQHQTYSKKNIEVVTQQSQELIKEANNSLSSFTNVLNDLLDRTEGIKVFIGKIMIELQKQDIIHQQMDHLNESMDAILLIINKHADKLEKAGERRNILALLHFLVVNSERQMTRINNEMINMVTQMEKLFAEMNESITDIKIDEESFSELIVDKERIHEGKSIMNRIFLLPKKMIMELKDNLSAILKQKQEIVRVYTEVVEKIKEEKNYAVKFLPVVEMINSLLLLARIEKERYRLDINNLDDKGNGFSVESVRELTEIVDQISSAYDDAEEKLVISEESIISQKVKYEDIQNGLDQSLNYIATTEQLFHDNYMTILDISQNLFSEIHQYIDHFRSLKDLNTQMNKNIKICSQIAEQVQQDLDAEGGIPSLDDCEFKDIILQNIVEKFTVKQERDTLREEFSELEIEDSSEGGITLF